MGGVARHSRLPAATRLEGGAREVNPSRPRLEKLTHNCILVVLVAVLVVACRGHQGSKAVRVLYVNVCLSLEQHLDNIAVRMGTGTKEHREPIENSHVDLAAIFKPAQDDARVASGHRQWARPSAHPPSSVQNDTCAAVV